MAGRFWHPRPGAPLGAAGAAGLADAAGAASPEALQGLRRFSLLLERLESQGGLAPGGGGVAAGAGAAQPGAPVAAEALAFAARSSHSGQELEQYLARLKAMGLETGTDKVFRALAQTVPGWVIPSAGGAGVAMPVMETGAIGAMRRIVTDAEDPVEVSKRFQEMVRAGVERFNEGSLPQAVQMLELAERLISERKVDAGSAEIVRRKLGEELDPEQLKKFAELPDQWAQLRKVLRFFTEWTPEGLLEALPGEPSGTGAA